MAYKLTNLGESRALRVGTVKDPENAVLTYLYEEKDSVELEEIAGETHMDDDVTERVVNRLVGKGYVKEV